MDRYVIMDYGWEHIFLSFESLLNEANWKQHGLQSDFKLHFVIFILLRALPIICKEPCFSQICWIDQNWGGGDTISSCCNKTAASSVLWRKKADNMASLTSLCMKCVNCLCHLERLKRIKNRPRKLHGYKFWESVQYKLEKESFSDWVIAW